MTTSKKPLTLAELRAAKSRKPLSPSKVTVQLKPTTVLRQPTPTPEVKVTKTKAEVAPPPPDFRPAIRRLHRWVTTRGTLSSAESLEALEDLVKHLRLLELPLKPPPSQVPLYRAVPVPSMKKFRASVKSRQCESYLEPLTEWMFNPQFTTDSAFLSTNNYGAVVSWYPPSGAFVADLQQVLAAMKSHKAAMAALAAFTKVEKLFLQVAIAVSARPSVIVRSSPMTVPMTGIVSSSDVFRRKLDRLKVKHEVAGRNVYVRLFDALDFLEELDLLLR